MKRIAVISDIHGNIQALRQIDQKLAGVDMIIFLGDLFTGGDYPCECYDYLKKLDINVWIKGNTDEWVDLNYDLDKLDVSCIEDAMKARTLLDKDRVNSVLHNEIVKTIEVERYKIYCIHDFGIENSSDLLTLGKRVKDLDANIILCGHTHRQMLLQTDYGILLNPGSAGDQHFAIIEIYESSCSIQLN